MKAEPGMNAHQEIQAQDHVHTAERGLIEDRDRQVLHRYLADLQRCHLVQHGLDSLNGCTPPMPVAMPNAFGFKFIRSAADAVRAVRFAPVSKIMFSNVPSITIGV